MSRQRDESVPVRTLSVRLHNRRIRGSLMRDTRQFFVIDKRTRQEPDLERIAIQELWAQGLAYCDIQGFALGADGSLYLLDDCGQYKPCPPDRFELVWVRSEETCTRC